MPNYCDYRLKVKGDKANCEKFLKKLEDYNEPNHFFRIFESDVIDEGDDYLVISGNCAWSLNACCGPDGYANGVDLFAVNTKDLNVEMEAWSKEEDGCFFEEYYLYKNGECLADEEMAIDECPPEWDKEYYPTFEEYVEDYFGDIENCPWTEADFDENGFCTSVEEGGFENWGEFSI